MLELVRLPDWNTRLHAIIAHSRRVGFEWDPEHDCGLSWAGADILAVTGYDISNDFSPDYKNVSGAVKFFKQLKVSSLGDLAALYLPEIPVAFARVGDLVAIKDSTPFKHHLGIVNGERVFVRRETGIATVDLLEAERAFKVG